MFQFFPEYFYKPKLVIPYQYIRRNVLFVGFTGVLLVICICIIYVYATQTARRLIFNGFWLTHKLITVMYILTILHGASTIVQKPMFFAYFIGPAILFTVDKMISMSRKKTELNVISAEKLPSGILY